MAEQLEEFEFTVGGSKPQYPWNDWLNGKPWRCVKDVDFTIPRVQFTDAARRAAKRKNVRVRCQQVGEKDVVIQAFPLDGSLPVAQTSVVAFPVTTSPVTELFRAVDQPIRDLLVAIASNSTDEWFTIGDAAEWLGVDTRKVQARIRALGEPCENYEATLWKMTKSGNTTLRQMLGNVRQDILATADAVGES